MLKRNLKISIILLLIALITFSFTYVFAEDEATQIIPDVNAASTTNNDISTISNGDSENNETEDSNITMPADEVISNALANAQIGDKYLSGDEITIDYVVDGNLYIMANKVTINSEIGGDAFIIANEVNIDKNAYIYSNLFTIASNLNISGVVSDLYTVTNNINISGYIYRDAKIATTSEVTLAGTIGRNAFVYGTSNFNFATNENSEGTGHGIISGNLNYFAPQQSDISTDNVGGQISYTNIVINNSNTEATSIKGIILSHIINLAGSVVLLLIVWLIGLKLAPKFIATVDKKLTKKPVSTLLFGILSLILVPIIALLLLVLIATIKVSFVLLGIYLILVAISSSIFTIGINNIICEKTKTTKTSVKTVYLILIAAALYLIKLIPYVGGIVSIAVTVLGLGMLLSCIFTKNKEEQNNEVTPATSQE